MPIRRGWSSVADIVTLALEELEHRGHVFVIRPQVPVVKNTENHVEILTDFYNHGYEYAQDIFEKAASFAGWEGEK